MRPSLPIAATAALLLGLLVAAPASAAQTGTVCGEVTAFTAPTAVADGSITIDGTTEVIDSSALASIGAATLTTLTAVTNADAMTCLEITANEAGEIVDLAVASQARVCGTVTFDSATDSYSIGGTTVPADSVSADGELQAVLAAAASVGGDACADMTLNAGGNGAVATVTVTTRLCGTVVVEGDGDASIGGAAVPASLTNAEARSVLQAAASVNGSACADVVARSANGSTTVTVTVTAQVCLEVTAVNGNTIVLGDGTFTLAGGADGSVQVGDQLCVTLSDGPSGPASAVLGATFGPGGTAALPDTATESRDSASGVGAALLALAAMGVVAAMRREVPEAR